MLDAVARRFARLSKLLRKSTKIRRLLVFSGECAVCGVSGSSRTLFVETGPWSRDDLRCTRCLSIPRERCLLEVLQRVRPDWRTASIHESSPGIRGASAALASAAADYSSSQFLADVERGVRRNGVRCEDLARLTFADASFDLFVTQDVLEHVLEPDAVFREIVRVLKPGGSHVATFPWYPHRATTRVRASLDPATGALVHHEPPDYHRSPVGNGQSLVTLDWGSDIFDRAARNGLLLEVHKLQQDRRRGVDGEFREVFVFRVAQTVGD